MNEYQKHQIYMRKDRVLTDAPVVCDICGCTGNNECGHENVGADCSVDPDFCICSCCAVVTPANDYEYDLLIGQLPILVPPTKALEDAPPVPHAMIGELPQDVFGCDGISPHARDAGFELNLGL